MSNNCRQHIFVRGEAEALTNWLQIATTPTSVRHLGQVVPPEAAWRLFHNFDPIPANILARTKEDADGWECNHWGLWSFVYLHYLNRDSSRKVDIHLDTHTEPCNEWLAKVAARFPDLEFELFWENETENRGRARFRMGKRDEYWEDDGKDADRMLSLQVRMVCGANRETIHLLDTEIAERPHDAGLYLMRAKAIWRVSDEFDEWKEWWVDELGRDPDQHINDLERALDLDPRLDEAYLKLACIRGLRKDTSGSKLAYQKAIKECPNSVRVLSRYARFLRNHVEEKEALTYAWNAQAIDPNDAEPWYEIALSHYMKGEFKESETTFERVIKLDPGDGYAHYYRGRCQLARNAHSDALQSFDEASIWTWSFNTRNAEYLLVRGQALIGLEEWEEAISCFTLCIELNRAPFTSTACADRAVCYSKTERYSDAIVDMTEAIKSQPQNTAFRSLLAQYHLMAGQFSDAKLSLSTIGDSDNLNNHPLMILLSCLNNLRNKGQDDFALESARMCSELFPDFAVSFWCQADILATSPDPRLRDGVEAVRLAKIACEMDGWKFPKYLSTYAATLAECGQFSEAVEWQQKAVAAIRDKEEMRAEFQSYLELYQSGQPRRFTPTKMV